MQKDCVLSYEKTFSYEDYCIFTGKKGKNMLKGVLIGVMIICFLPVWGETINYSTEDSVKVVILLKEAEILSPKESRIVFFAEKLLGTPYKGGTLEAQGKETLTVNLREVDCTTFVETVLALTMASCSKEQDFDGFVSALRRVRYRGGVVDGYFSRLHYFSDWILDNEKKGIVKEVSRDFSINKQTLDLHYMSSHPDSYAHLKNNPEGIEKIKAQEQKLTGISFCFMPTSLPNLKQTISKIKEGDIIAFVTSIDGLDVSHVGFAVRKGGKVGLLHASSVHKKVEIAALSLDEYMLSGKKITGIRILRVLPF